MRRDCNEDIESKIMELERTVSSKLRGLEEFTKINIRDLDAEVRQLRDQSPADSEERKRYQGLSKRLDRLVKSISKKKGE